jgi:hypothetical protein
MLKARSPFFGRTPSIERSHHRHRPGRDVFPAALREPFDLLCALYGALFVDQLNSVPSTHMRCRVTASFLHFEHRLGVTRVDADHRQAKPLELGP